MCVVNRAAFGPQRKTGAVGAGEVWSPYTREPSPRQGARDSERAGENHRREQGLKVRFLEGVPNTGGSNALRCEL